MKNHTRVWSLLLVICMVVAMLTPVAYAQSNSKASARTITMGSGGAKYEISGKTSAADPSNYTLKPANTSHSFPGPDAPVWSYLNQSHTGRRIYVESKRILMLFSNSDAANFPFVALQLHGLAAGTYDATFSLDLNVAGGCARVYVVSLADYQTALSGYESLFLTKETAVNSAAQTKIFERLTDSALNDPEKAVVDCYSGAAATQSIGNITLPADGDYVLVFRCAGPSSLNTTTNCQFRLSGLTLAPYVAEDDVPGHGGFDGGDGALPSAAQIAAEAAVQTISCTYAATDMVNGHDYIYLLFKGNTMMVYDLDDEKMVDIKRNVFSTPRGVYIDKNHTVWVCGATNSIYRYDPLSKTGEHLVMDLELIPFEGSLNLHGITGDGNGNIYFGTYNRGHIGMYNTKTGEFSKISDHLDATPETGKGADAQRAAYGGMILKDGYAYLGIDGNTNGDATTTHQIIKFDLEKRKIVDYVDVSTQLGNVVMLDHLNLVGDKYLFGSYSATLKGTVVVDISGADMKLVELDGVTGIIGDVSDAVDGKFYFMGPGSAGLMAFDTAAGTATATDISNSGYLKCCYGGTVTIDGLEGESLVTFSGVDAVDLIFYNLASGKTVIKSDVTNGVGSGNALQCIATSEDGKLIYVGAYGTNEVAVYDVENGKIIKTFNTSDHQTDGMILYEGNLYVGNYGSCAISAYDVQTGKMGSRLAKLESGTFYQNRIPSAAAGDGNVYFATVPGSNRLGGMLMWYDINRKLVYAAAGPSPEDVYYTTAGNLAAKGWYKMITGELADKQLDTNGDGQITQADATVITGETSAQRFTGVVENQVINNLVYQNGFLVGGTTRAGGSGATTVDNNNAQIVVYNTKTAELADTYDIADAIDGLLLPVEFIDAVEADPNEPGKFWGVVADTLFSFRVDMETGKISQVKEEISMGKDIYNNGGSLWYGRDILFDGDFMYVVFGTNGLYMIEQENLNNRYCLLAADLNANSFGVPKRMVQAADGNIYYMANSTDVYVLNIANALNEIKDSHGIAKVTGLIAALKPAEEITLEDEAAVIIARKEYEKLSENAKGQIDIAKLTEAEVAIAPLREAADKSAVENVIAMINAIGSVTLQSETKIVQAREAYDALSEAQKAKIGNYAVLTEAEAALDYLKIPAEDKTAAAAVDAQIEAVGTVDRYSSKTLEAARASYENLTDLQKSLVTKLDVLTDAEKAYEALMATITTCYDFDYVNSGLSFAGNSLYNQDGLIAHVNKHYNSGTLNWNVKALGYTTPKSNDLVFNASGYFQGRAVPGDWIAFVFKAPAAGNYDLKIVNPVSYCGAEEVTVYILPADTRDVAAALTDANLVGSFSCYDKTVEAEKPSLNDLRTNDLGIWTADGAGEYVLVFRCTKASEEALACYADRLAKDPDNTRDYGSNVYVTELYMTIADEDVLAVQAQIDAIGTITLESETAVKAIRAAYDALSDGQKADVNAELLIAAEEKIAQLQAAAEKEAADRIAAAEVIAKINAIGSVTLESETSVKDARASYDALTEDQKLLVDNLSVLRLAEASLAALQMSDNPNTGDTVPLVVFVAVLSVSAVALVAVTVSACKRKHV